MMHPLNISREGISFSVTSLREHTVQLKQSLRMSSSVSVITTLLALVSILLPTNGLPLEQETIKEKLCSSVPKCSYEFNDNCTLREVQEPSYSLFYCNLTLICCITAPIPETPVSTTTIQTKTLTFDPKIPGSLAQAICVENEKIANNRDWIEIFPSTESRCAKRKVFNNIINRAINAKEFPHVAYLGYDQNYNINNIIWEHTGSLISSKIVLAADHNVYSTTYGYVKYVKVGAIFSMSKHGEIQIVKIKDVIYSPRSGVDLYHKLVILRLENEVIYNEWVKPACLPVNMPDMNKDDNLIGIGWNGYHLHQSTFKFIGYCRQIRYSMPEYNNESINSEYEICVRKEIEQNQDSCQNTFEESLVTINRDNACMYDIVGIAKNNFYTCKRMDVYLRVQHYIPWIEQTAWPEYFNATL